MNIQQVNKLKKIMTSIDGDYKLSQLHYERQVELIDAIKYHQLQKPWRSKVAPLSASAAGITASLPACGSSAWMLPSVK